MYTTKPVCVLSLKFEDILSYCTASLVVVSSYRPCFCAQKQGLQTIKNSVNTNFIPVCTRLQTPGFSCHGLFPYFPITLLCIVVIAKQPGRQTSVHNCRRNCGCKVCGEQTHFFRNTTCILLSVFMPKVKSSELHPTNGADAPPVTNISPSFGWTSPSRSQRFMIKWLNPTVNYPQLLSGHSSLALNCRIYSLARRWRRLETRPATTDKKALGAVLYQRFKNGWGYTFWSYVLTLNCLLPCCTDILFYVLQQHKQFWEFQLFYRLSLKNRYRVSVQQKAHHSYTRYIITIYTILCAKVSL